MLPPKFRLTKSEFQAVRDHGQLYSAHLLAILTLYPVSHSNHSSHFNHSKAGIIVSRRLSPKAVSRNLLKRRLRAALQRVLSDLKSNLHLIVLPNRRALDAAVEELEKEIRLITQKTQKTQSPGVSEYQRVGKPETKWENLGSGILVF